jgi:hypothetical protein
MTTRRPLRPPPEPSRPAPLDTDELAEIEYRPLRHGVAAVLYVRPRRTATEQAMTSSEPSKLGDQP